MPKFKLKDKHIFIIPIVIIIIVLPISWCIGPKHGTLFIVNESGEGLGVSVWFRHVDEDSALKGTEDALIGIADDYSGRVAFTYYLDELPEITLSFGYIIEEREGDENQYLIISAKVAYIYVPVENDHPRYIITPSDLV